MRRNKTLYSLTVEDFQNVAQDEIGRALTDHELNQAADYVAERIPWYDLIAEFITSFPAPDNRLLTTDNQQLTTDH